MVHRRKEYLKHASAERLLLLSPDYDEALRDCSRSSVPVCIWVIFALASVIRRQIVAIYPDVSSSTLLDSIENGLLFGNATLTPISDERSDCEPFSVMWTRVDSDGSSPWTPNHFVPIVPRAAQENGSVMSQQCVDLEATQDYSSGTHLMSRK